MSAEKLREAAALMRERAVSAADVWGVSVWRASLSELKDRDGYREVPSYMQTHVAADDAHGSVILASPWTDQAPTIHAASWHPAVALAVADWLDASATHADSTGGRCICHEAALAVASAYLGDA
jgi:hypothetical protein